MKLFWIFLLLGGFCSWSSGELPKVEKLGGGLSIHHGAVYYNSKAFTGIEIERYLNGALYKENRYEKGLREGNSKEYSLNGRLRAVWHFHRGKKDGLQEGWFAGGPKQFEYHYKMGLLDGTQIEWHQNGNVFRQQIFKQGIETDKKIFFQEKEIFSNYSKRNGRVYGIDGGSLCLEVKKDGEK